MSDCHRMTFWSLSRELGTGVAMRTLGYALLLAAAMVVPAGAADYSGLLSGGYDHFSGSGYSADGYNVGGAALAAFGGGFNIQGNADYEQASLFGTKVKDTGFGGDLFWRGQMVAFGGSVRYDDLTATISLPAPIGGTFSSSDHVTSYGAFGEVYLGPQFTLKAKGGGTSGAFDGSYFAVAAQYYLLPRLSITPLYSYQDLGALGGHVDSYGAQAELFFSSRFPAGLGVSYAHSTSSGTSADVFMLSLTYRLGAPRDLAGWDRTGPTRWNGALSL